jgi:hypothetical protein
MLTGKKFKLERATLAITMVQGRRKAITIPLGAVIKVVSGPTGDGDRMVDVVWDGQTVEMFAVDVDVRGTEILDRDRRDDRSAHA